VSDGDGRFGGIRAGNQMGCAEQIEKRLTCESLPEAHDFILHHGNMRRRPAECRRSRTNKQAGEF
jgi:hypothetical protein